MESYDEERMIKALEDLAESQRMIALLLREISELIRESMKEART